MLASFFLRPLIRKGTLTITDANGRTHVFEGPEEGPRAAVRLHDRSLHWKLLVNPKLYVGEGYMDGGLTIEEGTLYDFLDLAGLNIRTFRLPRGLRWLVPVANWAALAQVYNPVGRAQKKVAHHYDLKDELFDLFLDEDRQYSCAYFTSDNESIDVAQENKKRHLAAKLLLDRPGLKVLDIGSGWGGLALYLARETGADVTGVTLSTEQHRVSNERAKKAGLSDRARFELKDYRDDDGKYDRIVSVGMFEHVGLLHYKEFFGKIRDLLEEDGIALIHFIGHNDTRGPVNPWIRKYIFPGTYTPTLSEVMPAVEKARLWVTDIEVLRLHYADTLREWNRRFQANRDKVRQMYDERFCRMWEFYLQGCEIGFRRMGLHVLQLQLAKRPDGVPLTRDYIHHWEGEHAGAPGAAA